MNFMGYLQMQESSARLPSYFSDRGDQAPGCLYAER